MAAIHEIAPDVFRIRYMRRKSTSNLVISWCVTTNRSYSTQDSGECSPRCGRK